MPRKKRPTTQIVETTQTVETAHANTPTSSTAVAEPKALVALAEPMRRPEYIDGPPVNEQGQIVKKPEPRPREWSNPYKSIVTAQGFTMGEDHRFKQRVFQFHDKPDPQVLAKLKENGFSYRSAEKAWTIPANPSTRVLTDRLAQEFAGPGRGAGRE